MMEFQRDDKVRINNPDYSPVNGCEGTVTNNWPTDFKVNLGGFEVVIKNPDTDLVPVPLNVNQLAKLLSTAQNLLVKGVKIRFTATGPEVEMPERYFLVAFPADPEDEFLIEDNGSAIFAEAVRHGVRFSSRVTDKEGMADLRAMVAAKNTASSVEAPQEAVPEGTGQTDAWP